MASDGDADTDSEWAIVPLFDQHFYLYPPIANFIRHENLAYDANDVPKKWFSQIYVDK